MSDRPSDSRANGEAKTVIVILENIYLKLLKILQDPLNVLNKQVLTRKVIFVQQFLIFLR